MTFAIVEGVALFAAVCATILRFGHPVLLDWIDAAYVLGQAASLAVCCIVAFYYNDLYDLRVVRTLGDFCSRLLQSFGVAIILLAGFYALFPDARVAEGPFISSLLVMVGILLPIRATGYAVMRHRAFTNRVVILGTGPLARKLVAAIEARPHLRYRVVGLIDDGDTADEAAFRHPVLGRLAELADLAEHAQADRIIVALSERRGRLPMRQLLDAESRGISVEDGLQTYERFTEKLAIESLTPSLLVFSPGFNKSVVQFALQRLVSLAVAAAGLLLTVPLMAVIAVAIKLDSRGSILFVHDRVGLRGRCFRLLKFRTMVDMDGPRSEWVHDNEARITRVGGWLRKYRLDELPQFVNILRGDMNLVGPRPHPASNYSSFIEQIPYYALRSLVRPGVTGWAQVRYGYANNLEEEIEKMRYDLYYIKHLAFWFDLRILVDTVKIILLGRGASSPDAYQPEPLPDSVRADRPSSLAAQPDLARNYLDVSPASGSAQHPANGNGHGHGNHVIAPRASVSPFPGTLSGLLSFDIEEWFQVENLRPVFPRANWERVPRRVGSATRAILDLLSEHQARGTFFILGWVAERERGLVADIVARGHEIAAHGYGHVMPMQLTPAEFREDVSRARQVLEDLTGKPVVGYRAPSFSLNREHLAILADCGYRYDSSFHPFTLHDRYARLDDLGTPIRPGVYPVDGRITELALPVERFGRLQLPISGGGYFRLYPGPLFRQLVRRAILRDGHYILYLHSWEFDAEMPRVKVPGFGSQFRHYNNISRTLSRLRELVAMLDAIDARFVTMESFVDSVSVPPAAVSKPGVVLSVATTAKGNGRARR